VVAASALMLGLGVVTGVGPASSAEPSASGWWTSTSVPTPVGGLLAPDAPSDGLLVQSGSSPEQPVAYAALRYELASDAVPSKLVLVIAPNSGSTADVGLRVCALADPAFEAASGGPAEEAPKYDCARSVTATPSAGKYEFDVASLADSGPLAVAVLPGDAPGRVVFSKPDAESLQTTSGTRGSSFDDGASLDVASDADASASDIGVLDGAAGSSSFDLPSGGVDLPSPAASPGAVPEPEPTPATEQPATPVVAAPTAAHEADDSGVSPGLIALAVAALAAAAWMAAGHSASSGDDDVAVSV
jgi:hypothetical protein